MSTKKQRIKLAINRLQIGVYIQMPVSWNDHPFMFNQFKITSDKQIAQLKKSNILHVWGIPAKSTNKPLAEAPPESLVLEGEVKLNQELKAMKKDKLDKIEQMKSYRRQIKKCEASYQTAISKVRSLTNKIQTRPLQAMTEAQDVINSMCEALLAKDNVVLHLVNVKRETIDPQQHAVTVSMLAMMIAKQLNYTKEQIIDVGIAGLMHDIGKLKIPQDFFTNREISAEKRKFIIEKHPQYSVDFLSLSPNIPSEIKTIVLEHHEFADGSGYPAGKTLNQLNPLSLIVSLVNYYEKLCFPYKAIKPLSPSQALSYIFKHKKKLFEPLQLNTFIKTMGIYPPGTVVKLSNDSIGIVITTDSNRLLYPNVLIYDETIPRNDAAIVDIEQEKLSIKGAVAISSLSPKIIEYLNPRTQVSFYLDEVSILPNEFDDK